MKSWGKPERAQAAAPADPRADARAAIESAHAQAKATLSRVQDRKK